MCGSARWDKEGRSVWLLTAKAKTPLGITLATSKGLVDQGKTSVVALSKVDADIIPAAVKIPRVVAAGAEVLLFYADTLSNGTTEAYTELNISAIVQVHCSIIPSISRILSTATAHLFAVFWVTKSDPPFDIPEEDLPRIPPRFPTIQLWA